MWATAMAGVADLSNQKVERVAWRTKPSAYIVATQDRTVNPELERFSANRMGAATYEVETAATCRCSPIPTSCSRRSATW